MHSHALKLAHRGYVMVNGLITMSGTAGSFWRGRNASGPSRGGRHCASRSFYDGGPNALLVFLLCTILLGSGAAYIMGKAVARRGGQFGRSPPTPFCSGSWCVFTHFALFEEVLLSARNFLVDVAFLLAAGLAGYMTARRRH